MNLSCQVKSMSPGVTRLGSNPSFTANAATQTQPCGLTLYTHCLTADSSVESCVWLSSKCVKNTSRAQSKRPIKRQLPSFLSPSSGPGFWKWWWFLKDKEKSHRWKWREPFQVNGTTQTRWPGDHQLLIQWPVSANEQVYVCMWK